MQRLVLLLTAGLVLLGAYTYQYSAEPDPKLIDLAVRATVYAMPSPTAHRVEVTRIVEVTRLVEIVRIVEATPVAADTPTPEPTPTPIAAVTLPPEPVAVAAAAAPVALSAAGPAAGIACPATSSATYAAIPVTGARAAHPDAEHGDLNLALRGYSPVDGTLSLIAINGPTDPDAPQLAGMFGDGRLPTFGALYQARDWDWGCGALGCRGGELHDYAATVAALQASPGEPVRVPSRGPEIYGGGYVALVLYAEPTRLTVVYTREDSVANGYTVHLDEICVDPNLLALYQASNAGGRGSLPAVHNGESVGVAGGGRVLVAIRDRGVFKDPRSRKDWWQGY